MSISLYDICIPNFIQTLKATGKVLEKGAAFAASENIELDSLLEISLHETMWPLRPQLVSVLHHTLGAIEGVKRGEFNPPVQMPDASYADFQRLIAETTDQIASLSEEEINALQGKPIKFKAGDFEMDFVAENFLLSFTLPNLYFHAATAYDLLRKEGVPLGKGDYLGRARKN